MTKENQTSQNCPLCLGNGIFKGEITARTANAYLTPASTRPDNYLIIPMEHIESLTALPDTWWHDVKELLPSVPSLPESYNLSFNIGEPAGQTLKHLHLWVIPRFEGAPSSGRGLATLVERVDEIGLAT